MKVVVEPQAHLSLASQLRTWMLERGHDFAPIFVSTVVIRAFGYENARGMAIARKTSGTSKPDEDIRNSSQKRARRVKYRNTLMHYFQLSQDEANEALIKIAYKGWWGFGRSVLTAPPTPTTNPAPQPPSAVEFNFATVEASRVKIRFENLRIPKRLARGLNLFAREFGLEIIGRNDLIAKLFGYDSFAELEAALDENAPDLPDWCTPTEDMKDRLAEYLRILSECGFTVPQAVRLLRELGIGGWWQFAERTKAHGDQPSDQAPMATVSNDQKFRPSSRNVASIRRAPRRS
jgi:hypothetical protein